MIEKLVELGHLNREELSPLWREIYQLDPPQNLSVQMMRQFITFEYQVRSSKGLNVKAKRKITQLQSPSKTRKGVSNQLKAGSQLLRDWNGITHKVEVLEAGFLWKGEKYNSLTVIAKLITGTHWSGPRFFGLNKKVKPTNG